MDFNPKSGTLRHKQTPEVLPASQYLQDRLQERRARNTRPKRTRQSDFGPRMTAGHDDDLFFAEAEDGRQALERSYDSVLEVASVACLELENWMSKWTA
jgi:hypothetical protein